jgi:hypothetical protein
VSRPGTWPDKSDCNMEGYYYDQRTENNVLRAPKKRLITIISMIYTCMRVFAHTRPNARFVVPSDVADNPVQTLTILPTKLSSPSQ